MGGRRSGEQSIQMSAPEGNQKNELFCSYAALLLSDCGADVTEDNLNAAISAAGGSVPGCYTSLFAKVAAMTSVSELVEGASQPGSGGGGSGAAAAPAAGGDAPKEEAKKESSSSDDAGGAGGMFEDDY